MTTSKQLESTLDDIFGKKAPAIPPTGKKVIVDCLPWISLILGVVTLLSALGLWQWAHRLDNAVSEANTLSHLYGGGNVVSSHVSAGIWLSLVVLIIEGFLYLLAYSGLSRRKKVGWNYLYYGALLNVAYGVVICFTNYGNTGNLIGALIGSSIGFWILFQIRSSYNVIQPTTASKSDTPKA